MDNAATILESDGLLHTKLPGFTPRQVQVQMALAVESAIKKSQQLIVEAATGTGKTFAYLIPALLSNKKIIISTGTKNLQDQLFEKDIPLLRSLLKIPFQAALLKGRNNYLCRYRTQLYNDDPAFFNKETISQLYHVKLWMNQTKQGDVAELKHIPENSQVWPYVTSTKDNCLSQECEFFKNCFVMKARQDALKAEIIIVNHHLFFADLVLKDSGFGELLPGADGVIFDEAHQLAEIASQFFSVSFGSRQLQELATDIQTEIIKSATSRQEVVNLCTNLQKYIMDLRLEFGAEKIRKPWHNIANKPTLKNIIAEIKSLLTILCENLASIATSDSNLENCRQRTAQLLDLFGKVTDNTPENQIHWFETFAKNFVIHLTPLYIAEIFKNYLTPDKAWIFTSATLTTNNQFDFYQQSMGLQRANTLKLDSVFDYQQQAALYLPTALPDPNAVDYTDKVVAAAIPVINAAGGRTFFLFTSYAALYKAEKILKEKIAYPLLVQGTMPKAELINQFKKLQNAVLLGTNSFWEGVDVKGKALTCVIIDKIPFASPQDPIIQARTQALRKVGLEPFTEYQIPQAIIALKQGIGRLIRDIDDRGLLMLCDPRLQTKNYSQLFLQSLPAMPILKNLMEIEQFLAELT